MAKTIRNADDMIAYLEAKALKDGPQSMAAIMAANAKAVKVDPQHKWDRDILKTM